MKLRCTHNSLRIRVRKSDLEVLASEGRVEEGLHFGPKSRLVFEIIVAKNHNIVSVEYKSNRIAVILPEETARHWIESQEVGIEAKQSLPRDGVLDILLEKDFPCLDRDEENKADTFWELAPDQPDAC